MLVLLVLMSTPAHAHTTFVPMVPVPVGPSIAPDPHVLAGDGYLVEIDPLAIPPWYGEHSDPLPLPPIESTPAVVVPPHWPPAYWPAR